MDNIPQVFPVVIQLIVKKWLHFRFLHLLRVGDAYADVADLHTLDGADEDAAPPVDDAGLDYAQKLSPRREAANGISLSNAQPIRKEIYPVSGCKNFETLKGSGSRRQIFCGIISIWD